MLAAALPPLLLAPRTQHTALARLLTHVQAVAASEAITASPPAFLAYIHVLTAVPFVCAVPSSQAVAASEAITASPSAFLAYIHVLTALAAGEKGARSMYLQVRRPAALAASAWYN